MASPSPDACVFRHNFSEGNDFVVRIETSDRGGRGSPRLLAQWVQRACNAVVPYNYFHSLTGCASGIWFIQWGEMDTFQCDTDDDPDEGADDPDPESAMFYHRVDVLVHNDERPRLPWSADELVILGTAPISKKVGADRIADALRTTDFEDGTPHVSKVGVSAVSPATMARYWWWLMGGRKGLGVKPMLTHGYADADVAGEFADMTGEFVLVSKCIPESSCSFGWPHYPPQVEDEYAEDDIKWSW